jgi:hypothetical protein
MVALRYPFTSSPAIPYTWKRSFLVTITQVRKSGSTPRSLTLARGNYATCICRCDYRFIRVVLNTGYASPDTGSNRWCCRHRQPSQCSRIRYPVAPCGKLRALLRCAADRVWDVMSDRHGWVIDTPPDNFITKSNACMPDSSPGFPS